MEIPNDRKALSQMQLPMLFEFRSKLEDQRLALAALTKTVNDLIAEKEEQDRKARGANPLGMARIGAK